MCPGYSNDQVLMLLTFGTNSNKSDWTVWLQHLSKLKSMKCGTQLKTSHHVHILPSMVIWHVFCLITPLISISTFYLDMPGNFLRIIITLVFLIIKATLPLYKERIKTLFATCVFVLDLKCTFLVKMCSGSSVWFTSHAFIGWEMMKLIEPQVSEILIFWDNAVRKLRKIEKCGQSSHIIEWQTHLTH